MKINKKLILGTANFLHPYGIFGNKVSQKKIRDILVFSKKKKIKYLEIAKDYNNSQYFLGELSNYFKVYNKIDLTPSFLKTISDTVTLSIGFPESNNSFIASNIFSLFGL